MLYNAFEWEYPTKIYYGIGASDNIIEKIKELKCSNPLIVTDSGFAQTEIYKAFKKIFNSSNISLNEFTEITSNPKSKTIDKAAKTIRENKNDIVIGLGGGSSIDSAKAIAMLATNKGELLDYKYDYNIDKIKNKSLPIIVIPTTSGTGSESNHWSVVTDENRRIKINVGSYLMAPTLAIIDPNLTITMNPGLTAATGMDALSHAIEIYCYKFIFPIPEAFAKESIELVFKHLVNAVKDGSSIDDREGMIIASLLGGWAFSMGEENGVHILAHVIGGMYNVHHGITCGNLLPFVMADNLEAMPERFEEMAKLMNIDEKINNRKIEAKDAVKAVFELIEEVKLPKLKDLIKLSNDDLETIAQKALKDPANGNLVKKLKIDDYLSILKKVFN